MRPNRRLAGLLASAALVFVACGTNSQGGGGGASAGASGGTGQASQAPAVSAGNVSGTLTIWGMGNEGAKLDQLVKGFTDENPNVTVNVTPVDWEQAVAKLQTAIGGRQTPDISQMGTDMMGQFAQTGALEAVPANFDKSNYFEGAWNTGVVNGTAYGVPWYVETRLLYYRTDIAEKAGITKPPATWDELKADAKAMQEKGGAKWGISLGTHNWQEWLPFAWQDGGDIYDGTKFTFDSPPVLESLNFYDSFFEEGLAPKSVPEGFDITPAFVEGSHPMFFSGPWHLGLIKDAGGAGFEGKWAIAPMPKKQTGTSFVGGSNFVVFKDSKNKEAAWAFLEYVSRPDVQVKWYDIATDLPAVQEAWQDQKLKSDKNVAMFGEQLKDARAQPAIGTWAEISDAINKQLEQMTVGGAAPDQAATAMQQQAASIGAGKPVD